MCTWGKTREHDRRTMARIERRVNLQRRKTDTTNAQARVMHWQFVGSLAGLAVSVCVLMYAIGA